MAGDDDKDQPFRSELPTTASAPDDPVANDNAEAPPKRDLKSQPMFQRPAMGASAERGGGSNDIARLLEEKLAMALTGQVQAIGIVTLTSEGHLSVDTRGDSNALCTGAAQMQRQCLALLFPVGHRGPLQS